MSLLALNSISPLNRPTPRPVYRKVEIECGRLIHAALVSRRFCELLLANPCKAIETGYYGERFSFSHTEKEQISAIHGGSLAEFSSQIKRFSEAHKASEVALKVEAA